MLPKDEELPAPPDFFLEVETAKAHGGWGAWVKLDPLTRAKLMAHDLHKSRRDGYYRERIAAHARADKKSFSPHNDPLDAIKARWFKKK